MFLGRRILIDDDLHPKFKYFYRLAAKEHKTYFKSNTDVTEHYRKRLLGYLEYTGIIGQSISAKQAAMSAALAADASDSDDAGFNEIAPLAVMVSGSGLRTDYDNESGNEECDANSTNQDSDNGEVAGDQSASESPKSTPQKEVKKKSKKRPNSRQDKD